MADEMPIPSAKIAKAIETVEAQLTKLTAGYSEHKSKSTGKTFWMHKESGAKSYKEPFNMDKKKELEASLAALKKKIAPKQSDIPWPPPSKAKPELPERPVGPDFTKAVLQDRERYDQAMTYFKHQLTSINDHWKTKIDLKIPSSIKTAQQLNDQAVAMGIMILRANSSAEDITPPYADPQGKPDQPSLVITFSTEMKHQVTIDIQKRKSLVVCKGYRPVFDSFGDLLVLFLGRPSSITGSSPAATKQKPTTLKHADAIAAWRAHQ